MTYQATAKVFEYVEPDEAAQTVASSAPRLLINVLNKTNAAVATNSLHDNLGDQTVQALEATAESPILTPSLKYGHHTAGTIMNPKFLAVNRNLTAV